MPDAPQRSGPSPMVIGGCLLFVFVLLPVVLILGVAVLMVGGGMATFMMV